MILIISSRLKPLFDQNLRPQRFTDLEWNQLQSLKSVVHAIAAVELLHCAHDQHLDKPPPEWKHHPLSLLAIMSILRCIRRKSELWTSRHRPVPCPQHPCSLFPSEHGPWYLSSLSTSQWCKAASLPCVALGSCTQPARSSNSSSGLNFLTCSHKPRSMLSISSWISTGILALKKRAAWPALFYSLAALGYFSTLIPFSSLLARFPSSPFLLCSTIPPPGWISFCYSPQGNNKRENQATMHQNSPCLSLIINHLIVTDSPCLITTTIIISLFQLHFVSATNILTLSIIIPEYHWRRHPQSRTATSPFHQLCNLNTSLEASTL